MKIETITERDDLLIRRLILEPGEHTDWHTDTCHRFSVVVQGSSLVIQYRDTQDTVEVVVHPGLADWETPTDRVHRAVNTGSDVYEEVVTFYRDNFSVEPQPRRE